MNGTREKRGEAVFGVTFRSGNGEKVNAHHSVQGAEEQDAKTPVGKVTITDPLGGRLEKKTASTQKENLGNNKPTEGVHTAWGGGRGGNPKISKCFPYVPNSPCIL